MAPDRLNAPARYALAVLAVAVATVLTVSFPLLRDRFTFFLFWPVITTIAWFAGTGPALLATTLAAGVVSILMPRTAPHVDLAVPIVVFTIIGAVSALVARWRGEAVRALRASHARFQLVADAAPVLIWISGRDGRCTWVNAPWRAFTGHALAEALGDGWLAAVHPDDRARRQAAYRQSAEAGEPVECTYRLRRADGAYRWMLERAAPLRAEGHGIEGWVGSATDVSEQRESVAEAERAREAAEAASRGKDAFLATLSHELRAPLSPILTWTRMLRGHALPDAQAVRALEIIERNARTQAQLIEDLLDVARIVEGKMRLRVRPVALDEVVRNAVETMRPAADAKEIRLQVVLDGTVAPIAGDPDRLQQVVWNLISNAVKFTPKGGRVHVVLERVNSHVEVAVSDTGQGIAPEQLPRLFERFWQGDASTTRAAAGLGLGLAIVRHLVELHGGAVTAESPGEGQGSTFTVKLPVMALTRLAGEEVRRHPVLQDAAPAATVRLDDIRVLLVDDDPDANEALRVLLDLCGAEVRVAGSAAHAVEILGRWKPDVLVTDIGMPVEDGYALLAAVRSRGDELAGLPAVALTAFASSDDRARLLSAGFQLHIAKPADPGELTAAVAAVAARPR